MDRYLNTVYLPSMKCYTLIGDFGSEPPQTRCSPLLFTLAQFACTSKVTAEIHETSNFIIYVVLYTEGNQTLANILNSPLITLVRRVDW
jgi:hypothetical protein